MIWHSTSAAEVLSELEVDDKRGLPNGAFSNTAKTLFQALKSLRI